MAGLVQIVLLAVVPALPGAGQSTAQDQPIRVLVDESYPPYAFRSSTGEIQGIIPDQWAEWSRTTGRPVRLIPLQWNDCLERMAGGEAEVLDSVFRTPDRERVFDFLDPYATIRVPVFFHESISGISRIEDLRGFRVAVKRGDACITTLRAHGVADLIEYPDYESIVADAAQGTVKLFCIDEPPALYYLNKFGLDLSFRSALNLGVGQFHRAVRKDRLPLQDGADLYRIVKDGFASIPRERYLAIERRWFGSPVMRYVNYSVVASIVGLLAAAIAALGFFSAFLRHRVASSTAELSQKAAALEASERKNQAFIQALPDLFLIMDRRGRYLECRTASPELLVTEEASLLGRTMEEAGIPPGVAEDIRKAIVHALDSGEMAVAEYRLTVSSGESDFEARCVKMDDERAIVIVRDLTAKERAERRLRDSLAEKEILLKEVHHRVKNNMQVISSLIQLQTPAVSDADRPLFTEMQHRIASMAQIHELLYNSDDLTAINAAEYIRKVVEDLHMSYSELCPDVAVELELEDAEWSMDSAVPLGLIVNEVVSNSFKHAFGSSGGSTLRVSFGAGPDGRHTLSIADDGPGLPTDWRSRLGESLGLTLVEQLALQLRGELSIVSEGGTRVDLVI